MTIAVTCDNCLSSYQLNGQHAVRKFECCQCGEVCKVPKGRFRSRVTADQYGADEYPDHGYGDDSASNRPLPGRSPANRRTKSRSTRSRRRSSHGAESVFHAYSASSLIWLGVPLGLAAMVMLLGLVAENVAGYVFVAICLAAGVFSMCGSIHGIIQAFREHVACGLLCLLLPLYSVFYLITRWDEQRPGFVTGLSMFLAILFSLAGLELAGVSVQ